VQEKYAARNFSSEVRNFFEKSTGDMETQQETERPTSIDWILQNVDLVISRAGASTIFEILGFKRPSILIPYPGSINGDQLENAIYLEKIGASILVQEKNLSAAKLSRTIKWLFSNKGILTSMSESTCRIRPPDVLKKISSKIQKVIYNQILI
jgi:UDP-N-acetylglucosamine--N-acetylmuramyl-(pentapeptide) pyrophosphoryl-undecaprenol N-acetylglucosamine transferase